MTLYEIDEAIMGCITVDEETGEAIVDEERLAELQMERDEKVEGVACWVKNLAAENAAIAVEQKALADRKKKNEAKIDRLKDFLALALQGQKFSSGKCAVSFRKSEAVEIDKDAVIPEAYMTVKVEQSPDKTALKAALKGGENIPGVTLAEHINATVK